MKLRTYLKGQEISIRHLARMSGVPLITLQLKIDRGLSETHQAMILNALHEYYAEGIRKLPQIKF